MGLGIQDLDIKNVALLSVWLFQLLIIDGICQQSLSNEYLGAKAPQIGLVENRDSHFWYSLMKVKWDFLLFEIFKK